MKIPRQTLRLCLLLLPVWLAGGAEIGRFVWLNSIPGPYERNGLVKGRDFVQFYVIGTLAREGAWEDMYDVARLERAAARIVPPAAGEVPVPVYGPQVALFLAPLTKLPYLDARWLWLASSIVFYLLASWLVIQEATALRRHRPLTWITLTSSPLLAVLLAVGQTSAFGVLAWAAAAAALSRSRFLLFGMCVGLLAYKPPLLFGPTLALLVLGQWRALAGIGICAAGQLVSSVVAAGIGPWQRHIEALSATSEYYHLTDTLPHQKHSLLGFFRLLLGGGPAAQVLTVIAALGLLWLWWHHRQQRLTVWFVPFLIGTSVLLSPHLYVYDLALLTPALLITAGALARRCETTWEHAAAWTGYALLYAPFSGPLAQQTRIQLSTILLVMFVIAVHHLWSASPSASDQERAVLDRR